MKNIIRTFILGGALVLIGSCEDAYQEDPVPASTPSTYSAQFLFVNATPDAPELELYVNNLVSGDPVSPGEAQTSYTTVPITSNAVITNTNIRTKASSGDIGGVLGSSDLIYRAGSANSNNFTATSGARYSIFAVDSINRPKPYRTLRYDKAADAYFGDATYYSSQNSFTAAKKVGVGDTTIYLNVEVFGDPAYTPSPLFASNNSIDAFNLVKKYNGNVNPTFMTSIGTVPLGSSDVGGIRYYLLQDVFRSFANAADSTTKAGFRVVNASPGSSTLFVRLKFVSGTGADININVVGSNPVSFSFVNVVNAVTGGLSPSVGSRTVTGTAATFDNQTIAPAGTPNTYDVEVSTNASFTQIITGATLSNVTFGGNANRASNYTILVSGIVGKTGSKAPKLTIIEHN